MIDTNWNAMYGTERVRFCSDCKLNVYNLSSMSRDEAEALLVKSEGRLCVRFYRRADGSVLTRDCPVGWRAIKTRASRTVTAVASLLIGFLAGVTTLRVPDALISALPVGEVPPPEDPDKYYMVFEYVPVIGEVDRDEFVKMGNAVPITMLERP